jgi:uncharacterized membrane protein (DUF485 family)
MQQPYPTGFDDPWYDELASGRRAGADAATPGEQPLPDVPEILGIPPRPPRRNDHPVDPPGDRGAVYLTMHRSADFQEVRRRHRRFVLPASCAFLACYLGYLALAVAAPGAMATGVGGGPFTVALLAGAGQFAVVALLTWAYVRHARRRRDPAALELRWQTQQLTRSVAGGGAR